MINKVYKLIKTFCGTLAGEVWGMGRSWFFKLFTTDLQRGKDKQFRGYISGKIYLQKTNLINYRGMLIKCNNADKN